MALSVFIHIFHLVKWDNPLFVATLSKKLAEDSGRRHCAGSQRFFLMLRQNRSFRRWQGKIVVAVNSALRLGAHSLADAADPAKPAR